MKKAPNEFKLRHLQLHIRVGPRRQSKRGNWVPARPEGHFGFWHRLRLAWKVFRGKGDVLIWPDNQ